MTGWAVYLVALAGVWLVSLAGARLAARLGGRKPRGRRAPGAYGGGPASVDDLLNQMTWIWRRDA